jgi:hypothetical protein
MRSKAAQAIVALAVLLAPATAHAASWTDHLVVPFTGEVSVSTSTSWTLGNIGYTTFASNWNGPCARSDDPTGTGHLTLVNDCYVMANEGGTVHEAIISGCDSGDFQGDMTVSVYEHGTLSRTYTASVEFMPQAGYGPIGGNVQLGGDLGYTAIASGTLATTTPSGNPLECLGLGSPWGVSGFDTTGVLALQFTDATVG